MRMFAIHDVKAEVFNTPFFMRTVPEAIRGFMNEAASPDSAIGKWPDDFVLYELGEFDQVTGAVSVRDTPYRVMSGFEAKPGVKAVG